MSHVSFFSFLRVVFLCLLFGGASGIGVSLWMLRSSSDYQASLFGRPGSLHLSEQRPPQVPERETDIVVALRAHGSYGIVGIYPDGSVLSPQSVPADPSLQGIVLTSDGWIWTSPSAPFTHQPVVAYNGSFYSVQTQIPDPSTNSLFLKIEASGLPVTAFGNTTTLQKGDRLFLLPREDHLFPVTFSGFTRVSSPTSSIENPLKRLRLSPDLTPIDRGGMLITAEGKLVAMVAVASDATLSVIPIESILPSIKSLLKEGTVKRPFIGLSVSSWLEQSVSPGENLFHVGRGVRVTSVDPTGPAAKAGLRVGDILLTLDDQPISLMSSLDQLFLNYVPGDTLVFHIQRSGSPEQDIRVIATTRDNGPVVEVE